MEWDAGAFMRIAIGIFFLAFGAGLAYSLFRLSAVLGRLNRILTDANKEITPLLTRVETTLDGVNCRTRQSGRNHRVCGRDGKGSRTAGDGRLWRGSKPVKKVAGLAAGVNEGFSSLLIW